MEKINLCLCVNDAYAPSCAQTMLSVIKNTKADCINFYIFYSNLSNSNMKKLSRIQNAEFVKISEEEFDVFFVPKNTHFSKEAYFRLKIPYLLSDIDKVLYLDCDLTILADIERLYNINIDNYYLAAVKNINSRDNYFNSGVILINCKKWRKEIKFEDLINLASELGDKLQFVDQDLLNELFLKDVLFVDERWNFQYIPSLKRRKELSEINKEIKEGKFFVIHYLTNHKPWLQIRHEYRNLYLYYLKYTPYKMFYLKNILKNILC